MKDPNTGAYLILAGNAISLVAVLVLVWAHRDLAQALKKLLEANRELMEALERSSGKLHR